MGIEEGLGEPIRSLEFVVTSVNGNRVTTDFFPEQFDISEYAPFDYKVGQRYIRDIWRNGDFVISEATHEAYLVSKGSAPIKVEGSLDEFIRKIQAEGKRNKFERLLGEGKIEARVRIHAYDGRRALLEVALAEDSDWIGRGASDPFEAYSVLVNLADGTAKILEATYQHNTFDENSAHFRAAKQVQLPQAILDVARPQDIVTYLVTSNNFKPLDTQSMVFIREKCYRPSSA